MKYFGISLIKEVKELYNENFKSQKRKRKRGERGRKEQKKKEKIEAYTRRWKDLPCSEVIRIIISKMVILLKAVCRLDMSSIKISMHFTETENSNFIRKHTQNKNTRNNPEQQNCWNYHHPKFQVML